MGGNTPIRQNVHPTTSGEKCYLKEAGHADIKWINLADDTAQQREVQNTYMNLRFSMKIKNCLSNC